MWGGDFIEKAAYDEIVALSEQKMDNRGLVRTGDVLVASTGTGTMGKSCVYERDYPAVADGHVTIIRPDTERVDPGYLADYLRCGFGRVQIDRIFTGSTGLIELAPAQVESIVVDLHDGIDEQTERSVALRVRESSFLEASQEAENDLEVARREFLNASAQTAGEGAYAD